ncbi:uncharacterized protein PHALS_02774 [Plasmopara halstedii]|uniref:Uncharacterized protein n=1 Tax=Plasmopara halstedii TaxID=4781 RepID=A0A0N7L785_PLAHL|nr:uncharacterized protein PHALS_02774 [Plasmopara halstedii]CEG46371.1 hypothetical protein PHALS_02774 [Plasmopara halstedii]|eukprot:XP_024582740.1 hypothetical protein PHALS_02774 [Plasmopara halstedii]
MTQSDILMLEFATHPFVSRSRLKEAPQPRSFKPIRCPISCGATVKRSSFSPFNYKPRVVPERGDVPSREQRH